MNIKKQEGVEQLFCKNCGQGWTRDARWRDLPANCPVCGRREPLPETAEESMTKEEN